MDSNSTVINGTDVLGGGNQDQPASTRNDSLGFRPYVDAVYSFVINPETEAPFTLAIEGDWGVGKSSFMLQLQELLNDNGYRTIKFNAWRHDKVEGMWAAFAIHFIDELLQGMNWFKRLVVNLKLRLKRFDWTRGFLPLLNAILVLVLYFYITFIILFKIGIRTDFIKDNKANLGSIISLLGQGGLIIAIPLILKQIGGILGNPFKADLRKLLNTPNYDQNVVFIEEFHKDFKRIIDTLVNKDEKIFVFIDDLDRAEIPKATELMQGLNMMMTESPQIIFIIGMDREKVAAGVAAKYKDLIPYLYHQPTSGVNGNFEQAYNFGHSFMEKFVQLSFRVPRPSIKYTRNFIDSLSGIEHVQSRVEPVVFTDILQVGQGKDAAIFREVTYEIACFFDYNPRRIKQFVNAFRLKAHIAHKTGLFASNFGLGKKALTIPQLGKFIALIMLWPDLIAAMAEDPRLMEYLYFDSELEVGKKWKEKGDLMKLFHLESSVNPNGDEDWELKDINFGPLLETTSLYRPNLI